MVTGELSESADEPSLPDPFEVISIQAVIAPHGERGQEWHRYEISQGPNRIVGYRAGARDVVREAVDLIVLGLNLRRNLKRGRVHVILGRKSASPSQP